MVFKHQQNIINSKHGECYKNISTLKAEVRTQAKFNLGLIRKHFGVMVL